MNREIFEVCDEAEALVDYWEETFDDEWTIGLSLEQITSERQKRLALVGKELHANIEDRVDKYSAMYRKFESDAATAKRERDRVDAIYKRNKSKAAWFKDRIKDVMDSRGFKKLVGEHSKVSVVKNGGKRPLIIENENFIPSFYRDLNRAPINKDMLRIAVISGEELNLPAAAGVRLGDSGTHLRIK